MSKIKKKIQDKIMNQESFILHWCKTTKTKNAFIVEMYKGKNFIINITKIIARFMEKKILF